MILDFSLRIIEWYAVNKRDLPWRDITNPYYIWLSEVILQQTKVNQGLNYYFRFITQFPNVEMLALAHEDTVLKLWQGLGYYSRARNLHAAAKAIYFDFGGAFPSDYLSIRGLKGVGDYSAAAIASIAFGLPYAAVDGNVYRVLSRIFGIYIPINIGSAKKEFSTLANSLLDKQRPGLFNQAIMEFGALQCSPRNPLCDNCIFCTDCFALIHQAISALPNKLQGAKPKMRYFNYFLIKHLGYVYLSKRKSDDIWMNLFEFPLIETNELLDPENILDSEKLNLIFSKFAVLIGLPTIIITRVSKLYKHVLTHQKLMVRFFELEVTDTNWFPNTSNMLKIESTNINRYAIPKIIEKYLIENNYMV